MRYLRLLAILGAVCLVPAAQAHAQEVVVGLGIGAPAFIGPEPVCPYGYFPYYPYACAPVGYYGPNWFVGGVFIGAGPWYHFHGPVGFHGRPLPGPRPGFNARPGFRPAPAPRAPARVAPGTGFRGGSTFHGNPGGHGHR